jgi:CheY-like chemotaxis protein
VQDHGAPPSLHDLPPLALSLANRELRQTMHDYLCSRGARVSTELTAGTRLLIVDEEEDLRPLSETRSDLRIIYLGKARPNRSGGHLNFLRKPLKFSRLLRLLREVSGNAHDSGRRATLSVPIPARPLKGRVLVAEDNPINRRVLMLMLEKMGLEVSAVENGQRAAEAALSGGFDLVLMDCQMPLMDGHEATRLVRQQWTEPRPLPIIAVTANALEGEAERCKQSGMDDYLAKPITVEDLRQMVERWIGTAHRETSSEAGRGAGETV